MHQHTRNALQLVCYAALGLTSVTNEILVNTELLGMRLKESKTARQMPNCNQPQYMLRGKLTRTFNASVRAAERLLSQDL